MDENHPAPAEPSEAFPTATVRQKGSFSAWLAQSTLLVWLVAAACVVAAIFISFKALTPTGFPITVTFANGHGLKPEDQVRYRGIVVGEVDSIQLDESLQGVTVHIHLVDEAASLARAGSQFWIERPSVSLQGVRGIDTIVGGRYVSVFPGAEGAATQTDFRGGEEPPPTIDVIHGGLELNLVAENRHGMERGAPVTYRGLEVGQVGSVQLSQDTHSIEIRAVIDPRYQHLVRTNSRFWNNGGIDVNFGLTRGFDMGVDTLSSLVQGGIAFATPQPAGETVSGGHQFTLSEEEVDGWQDWRPMLQLGRDALRDQIEKKEDKPGFLNRIRSRLSGDVEEKPSEE